MYAQDLATRFELDLNKRQNKLSKGQDSIFKIIFGLASRAPVTIFDEPIIGLDAVARDLFYRELIDAYGLNPRLFILDEAFGALDVMTRREIHEELLTLQNEEPRTIILVTHDVREAMKLADSLIIFEEGKIQQDLMAL